MRNTIGVLTVCILAGCAGSPPKPPGVKGEYRPVNKVELQDSATNQTVIPAIFNFKYEGDIVGSLDALRAIQPQLNVTPPVGKVSPLPVRVNLRGTTLENALRAIGERGGNVAEVVWNTTRRQGGGNQVFIRFRAAYQQFGDAAATPSAGKN